MELEPGFKLSEAGPIPEDWEAVRLGELGQFKNGINKPAGAFGSGYPFVNLMDVFDISRIDRPEKLGLIESSDIDRSVYDLRAGDVLFVRSSVKPSGVGLATLIAQPLPQTVFSGFLLRFRDQGQLATGFKQHCFLTPSFRTRLIASSTVSANTNINQTALADLILPFPPTLPEQWAIARVLGEIDTWIAAGEAEATKLASVKAAAMDALLTPTTRLPGFPGEWERDRFGDRGSFKKGRGITRAHVRGSGLPAVRYGELYTRFTDHIRGFYSFIDREASLAAQRLNFGDVCFAASGETAEEIGKCAALLVDTEAYAGGDIIVFSAFNDDPAFLGYYLNMPKIAEQKARLGQGDAVVHIHAEKLADLEVIMPSLAEQRAIATVLSDIDAALAAARAVVAKAKAVKAAAMDALLSGRIRLPLPLHHASHGPPPQQVGED